jgi:cytoskeletal protein CcmA (bactofilin family)
MKKSILLILGLNYYSQNTIPTTTVTGALSVNDSLKVTRHISTDGNVISKGEIVSKDTMRAQKDVLVDGNVAIGGKLKVDGKSFFKNDITIKKSIIFDGGNEFSYMPATSTSKATFFLGSSVAKTSGWNQCPNPNAISSGFTQFAFPGSLVLRTPAGAIGLTNSALTMFSAPWDGNAFIEVEGIDNAGTSNNGLYINHFCSRNTHINPIGILLAL